MKKLYLRLLLLTVTILAMVAGFSQSWNQILKFSGADRTTRSVAARGSDNFGRALAIDGNYAAVAAPSETHDTLGGNPLTGAGSVLLYQFSAGSWNLVKKLVAPDRQTDDRFGYSVALQGSTLVVGTPAADLDADGYNNLTDAGAAYVFEKDKGGTDNWGFAKKLVAPFRNYYDVFGNSVAVSSNIIAVGSYLEDEDAANNNSLDGSGAVYLFARNEGGAGSWGLVKKLVPTDRSLYAGFGYAVSISNGILAVGAYQEYFDVNGANSLNNAGAVYIYSADAGGVGNWGQVKKLVAFDRANGDKFGQSVWFSNGLLAVGAPYEDEDESGANTRSNAGSAYLFQQDYGGTNAWGFMKKLVAADRAVDDNFGYSITLASDMVAVGAYAEDEDAAGLNTQANAGSAYIFSRYSGGINNWGQVKKLLAPDRAAGDQFSISLAASGSSIIVGADLEDEDTQGLNTVGSAGSVYLYAQDAGGANNWGNQQKIVLTDRVPDQQFGYSVAIDGDYAVVAHRGDFADAAGQNHMANAGSAWVLKNVNGFWTPVKKLVASDRAAGDNFGTSVAISGTMVVVSSPYEDEDLAGLNTKVNAGSAYIFSKDQGGTDNWGQVKKLVASDRSIADQFGSSVSISGTVVAVGAYLEDEDAAGANAKSDAGSVYIFYKDQGGTDNWGQLKKVVASDRTGLDYFGFSTALSGSMLLVGAYYQDEGALNAGAAYLFAKDQGGTNTWGQVKKLYAPDRAASDLFGTSVTISGNIAVVGAHYEDEDAAGANTKTNAGSAYLFAKDQGGTGNWGLVKKIVPTDREAGDLFGYTVAISDTIVAIGAPYESHDAMGTNQFIRAGSAYLFTQNQGGANNWGQAQKTSAADRGTFDYFAYTIALSGRTVLAGAYQEDEDLYGLHSLYNAGSVYLFKGGCTSYTLTAQGGMVVGNQSAAVTSYYNNNCALLATAEATGANPLTGSVALRVWIDPVQPEGYVLRHYEVTPALNPESSTARITLYFTQAEFDAFNTQNAVKLPTGPSDAAGKANLLVEKRGGVSSDGSGSPFTYPGQPETINPADNNIVWNAIENRWEVTFDVTGFSGFFVKTTAGALPLRWLQVTARLNARQQAEISWQVSEKDVAGYTIESSSHGRSFAAIASIQGQGDGVHTYRFTEASTLQGEALYRIKQTDLKGGNNYSIVLKLNVGNRRQISVHPNPVMNNLVITVAPELINSTLKLTDVQGRVVMQTRITAQTTSIDVSRLGKGHYQINIGNEAAIRIMKQ